MQRDPRGWWRRAFSQAHYSLLRYGVRFFLQFGSGNAYLERMFAYAEECSSDKRRNRLNLRRHLLLRTNGNEVGLEGYLRFTATIEASPGRH